ncbi:glycosyltransferase involved in cell wall biosynthesis [Dysgonomonas alginatilytica]|uniref:Glycosyltransferase involved in cell wall biosynthesis n=1 Tax=Dysgonomonas alginatilytica TaxID=1605892 RepID=A0A2V3PPA8_9BACT|nr:glycosyltransferase [Dysgonomonas alginatilytica]PXV64124.1 glycosyltransferase involved in cell wall biosynthesis [Dysgonomonas alginatilytica]
MKLSIITINYNNAGGLERTVKSIVNQDFSDFEYIVIDGASIDNSVDIIKTYSEKIDYWVSEPDTGVYNAMNKGIRQAKGEYLLFINSGDTLYTNDVLSKVFEFNPKHDLVYGNLHRIFPDGHEDIVRMPKHVSVLHMLRATLTHPTTFIRRGLFEKYGYYREDLKIVSDWAFFLKIIAFTNSTQEYIPIVISSFEMNGMSSNNADLVESERYKVVSESFSPELNHICYTQELYANFYNKRVFRVLRTARKLVSDFLSVAKKIITLGFSKKKNKEYIYRERIHPLIWCFNKNVRRQKSDTGKVPIIIINYNRLSDLKEMVDFFLKRNHKNIVIVDNDSQYPPLLEYYDQIKNTVVVKRMDRNYGHLVFWDNKELYREYASGYYIVTDSDIIPNKNLPENYLEQLIKVLDKYTKVTKVGFALEIDDIPDSFSAKEEVIAWEKKYWEIPITDNVYVADTDTTFAIYPPYYEHNKKTFLKGLRIGGDFTAQHRGWYIDSQNLSEEDKFYFKTSNNSNSWKLSEDGIFQGESAYNTKT